MNIKLTGLVLGTALSALAFTACETAPTSNNKSVTVSNNTAVVTNDNAKVVSSNNNTTTVTDTGNRWTNTNSVTREDYNKSRADYEKDKGTSTIGTGANDSWLWFKTRAALLTTADLRESTINVDVVNDVITLKGTVANEAQKKKAGEVANGIEGKKSVNNELKVAPADSMMNTNSGTNTNANKK